MYKILLGLLIAVTAHATDVNKIVEKAHLASYYQGNDGKGQLLMKVYAKGSDKPIKKLFYMLRLDIKDGGEQMFYTYFVKPTDIKRTTFLVHKKIKDDDFRRLYIPASDKVLAIAGSRKQDPFMGSDFTYEDVSGRHFSKDNHKLLGEEKLDGKDVYVTESIPKVKEDKISKMKAWIDKKTYMPMKVEYYNHDGKVYRVYTTDKMSNVQGFPTITIRTMKSVLDGTKTEMLLNPKSIKYDIGLDKGIFSERSLKNPPMEHLK
jgi:outer membrane lipoprotein-sorting protein